jgi:hypothetical protein
MFDLQSRINFQKVEFAFNRVLCIINRLGKRRTTINSTVPAPSYPINLPIVTAAMVIWRRNPPSSTGEGVSWFQFKPLKCQSNLDNFLMAALDGAFTLKAVKHVTVLIAHDLNLYYY